MAAKPFSQACENNKAPILEVIRRHLQSKDKVLEVGSGTGQHGVYFASQLPGIFWQTSDLPDNHPGINAWIDNANLANIGRPITLDVCADPWPEGFDAVFSANTCHIMPWQAVQQFIPRVGKHLPVAGIFCLYGPFNYNGSFTSDSNARFDQWLKQQAPHQGIRDFEAIDELAKVAGLELLEDNAMPANNRLLVWRKDKSKETP